jgi:hypothetical protein
MRALNSAGMRADPHAVRMRAAIGAGMRALIRTQATARQSRASLAPI